MPRKLKLSVGQHSHRGRKEANQDFHGALIPQEPALSLKGIAIVIADGISSSNVSHIASETAVKSFLTDYYCTPESWSVKTSAQRVLAATNSWLHAQTRHSQYRYDQDKGYVCTVSALVIKSATAHIFHVGDARVYRMSGRSIEQITHDHRIVVSSEQNYLSRALGMNAQLEIDYHTLQITPGDVFVLLTDGVYEFVSEQNLAAAIARGDAELDVIAKAIVDEAFSHGSGDNLTVQIVRVDDVPEGDGRDVFSDTATLPPPPLLDARMLFDGYRIVRDIHSSSRSHIYLAVDIETDTLVAIKIPSIDLRDDPAYLKRFMMEEWTARRIDSPHVLKAAPPARARNFLYVVMEYVEGQTLTQWMIDNPSPDLETFRDIVEQIARGLRAFHRREMLHQDLRPENILIDKTRTVKIIDFGSTSVTGVIETEAPPERIEVLGTQQYSAPEYFLGDNGSPRSDMFSLGVIAYEMLTGRLPYDTQIAKARTRAQFRKLTYQTATDDRHAIPVWIDGALRRAVHPEPGKRYESLSEFTFDLRRANAKYSAPLPLLERDPLLFWKSATALLACAVVALLAIMHTR